MAETDDDVNAGHFLSLSPALAYLEKGTKSPAYAELLLRNGCAEEVIRYREYETEVHFPVRGKPRVLGRVFVPCLPPDSADFWRIDPLDDSAQLEFDRKRAEVTRIDHAAQNLDGTWREYRIVRKRGSVLQGRSEEDVAMGGAPATGRAPARVGAGCPAS
jgi:hypothetical protein